jgi:hypothetical protein
LKEQGTVAHKQEPYGVAREITAKETRPLGRQEAEKLYDCQYAKLVEDVGQKEAQAYIATLLED